ncbi:hypothetical protein DFH09DRAFT_1089168 [Mycena vulgaris]|nr:hypothetical protein DFH09DRAFT_1089168 [Mycena vulgaris]
MSTIHSPQLTGSRGLSQWGGAILDQVIKAVILGMCGLYMTPKNPANFAEDRHASTADAENWSRPILNPELPPLIHGQKCDGARPICGQCGRANRPDDCEYTDGRRRARAEILQESISRVESRIYELEHPQRNGKTGILLHQAYQTNIVDFQHASFFGVFLNAVEDPWATADEPPMDVVEKLHRIDSFLPYSSEFVFFLNASRFRQCALMRYPIGHHARPAPALLSVVYLWGLRLSKEPQLIPQEPGFLSRALKLIAKGLSTIHPPKIMHNLQAEMLLAYYFFASGRFLEGKYHTAAAVSLGLSTRIHTVRSVNVPSAGPLPAPRDAIEEGERIHAFWILMVLDKTWAVSLSENPHLDLQHPSCSVDTHWPLEMDDYKKGRLNSAARYNSTVHKFFHGVPTSDRGMSTIAMLSKAALLWQRADRLVRDWKPDMLEAERTAFEILFSALDGRIDDFRATLVPPNQIMQPTPTMIRTLVVAHSIAHTATIRLYSIPPVCADTAGGRKSLAAARAVLSIIVSVPLQHFSYINPIMGTVWVAACQIILDKIHAIGGQRAAGPGCQERESLTALLGQTLDVLPAFAATFPLLSAFAEPPALQLLKRTTQTIKFPGYRRRVIDWFRTSVYGELDHDPRTENVRGTLPDPGSIDRRARERGRARRS